jgi:hypothetical protein
VTIEFFELDDQAKRKNLVREGAFVIVALHPYLEKLANGATAIAKSKHSTWWMVLHPRGHPTPTARRAIKNFSKKTEQKPRTSSTGHLY